MRMTKAMPKEVSMGADFAAELTISALNCAGNVVVRDEIPEGVKYVRSEPAAVVEGNQLIWRIGKMDAGETVNARIWFKPERQGRIVNCATVSADPRTCAETIVVQPAIQLTKTQPADVIICDPIPARLVVRNAGTSRLTGVKVTDRLPEGLATEGRNSVVFDAGTLAPGESKEFTFNATAARTGKYVNTAEATSEQGVTAKATATTAVHEAVLAITCNAREQQYLGRPFEVCFTLTNGGDAAAAGTVVTMPIPNGATFASATAGGKVAGGNVVWELGSVAANAKQDLCATFTATTAGVYRFTAVAKGTCAKQVTTTCETRTIGVSALLLEKADDPDPIQIGENIKYTVKVTNQGTAEDTNVKVVVQFPEEITPVSASNGGVVSGKTVTFPAFQRLAPRQAFEYTIIAKGAKVGDARVTFIRTSDGIPAPTTAEESTRVY